MDTAVQRKQESHAFPGLSRSIKKRRKDAHGGSGGDETNPTILLFDGE